MKRYEPSTPRAMIAALAVCMTLATATVMVIAPAAVQSDADAIIARVRPAETVVTIHPSHIDVVGVREHVDTWKQASNRAADNANVE